MWSVGIEPSYHVSTYLYLRARLGVSSDGFSFGKMGRLGMSFRRRINRRLPWKNWSRFVKVAADARRTQGTFPLRRLAIGLPLYN